MDALSAIKTNTRHRTKVPRVTGIQRGALIKQVQNYIKDDTTKHFKALGKKITLTVVGKLVTHVMIRLVDLLQETHRVQIGGFAFKKQTGGPMVVGTRGGTLYPVRPTVEVKVELTEAVKKKLMPPDFSPPRQPRGRRMRYHESDP